LYITACGAVPPSHRTHTSSVNPLVSVVTTLVARADAEPPNSTVLRAIPVEIWAPELIQIDSGPDSVDVGISLTVDAAGQILVLGSTNGSPWIRKYGPALDFYWMHAVTGVNPVARRIVADAQGNIVLVGDEQVGSQRDAFVRKLGSSPLSRDAGSR